MPLGRRRYKQALPLCWAILTNCFPVGGAQLLQPLSGTPVPRAPQAPHESESSSLRGPAPHVWRKACSPRSSRCSGSERHFNLHLVKLLLDAAVHFTPYGPLLDGERLETGL